MGIPTMCIVVMVAKVRKYWEISKGCKGKGEVGGVKPLFTCHQKQGKGKLYPYLWIVSNDTKVKMSIFDYHITEGIVYESRSVKQASCIQVS